MKRLIRRLSEEPATKRFDSALDARSQLAQRARPIALRRLGPDLQPAFLGRLGLNAGLMGAQPQQCEAATAAEIDQEANATLHSFVNQTPGARELANKAAGILVFPSVVKAGVGFGGEYGEGIMLNQQRVVGYYNLISASFGFQLGVQERSVIIMFMTRDALDQFDRIAGRDESVGGPVHIRNGH